MAFPGVAAAKDRADLVAFLKTKSSWHLLITPTFKEALDFFNLTDKN